MKIAVVIAAVATSLAYAQGQVPVWGQCGGDGYTGSTVCAAGSTCFTFNEWYSQCHPSVDAPPSAAPTTAPTTAPTAAPTTAPTTAPTAAPTAAPTTAPTKAPTAAPTTSPTQAPTVAPTSAPAPPSTKIYFGTATDRPGNYGTIVPDNFNLLVSENGMKWDAHERSRGVFDFSSSLSQIAYAKKNNMKMRGHCLVWHNQMPSFYCSQQSGGTDGCIASPLTGDELLAVIETRMQKTFAALNDPTIIAWDVLNEAVADDGSGLKHDVYYNTIGPDYVTKIFTLARKYAPAGVKLFYNDYGCDFPGFKANQCFKLVSDLKAKGLVDGMGVFQMHVSENQNTAGQADLFKRFSDIGVTIHVTEMDVGGSNQQAQANVFKTVATNCQQNPNCEDFVVWGVSDKDSWRTGDNALLFDSNLQKKPQFAACHDVISQGHI
ncbi:unnamed protein product [Aphanomyces euteiches]